MGQAGRPLQPIGLEISSAVEGDADRHPEGQPARHIERQLHAQPCQQVRQIDVVQAHGGVQVGRRSFLASGLIELRDLFQHLRSAATSQLVDLLTTVSAWPTSRAGWREMGRAGAAGTTERGVEVDSGAITWSSMCKMGERGLM